MRSIGKRSPGLNAAAVATALRLRETAGRGGRWVGADALRELRSEAVQRGLASRRR